jgi:hypothetical protein
LKYYDTTIDEAILRALYIGKTITFNTLLEKAGKIRGRNYNKHSKKYEIARAAFNSHIKNLVKQNMDRQLIFTIKELNICLIAGMLWNIWVLQKRNLKRHLLY